MPLINRNWTPRQADEWTKEDTITIILSPLIYVLLTLGTVLSLLLIPIGFAVLLAGIVLTAIMVYIINPKLSAVSRGYEQKQKQYLKDLEKKIQWQEDDNG